MGQSDVPTSHEAAAYWQQISQHDVAKVLVLYERIHRHTR